MFFVSASQNRSEGATLSKPRVERRERTNAAQPWEKGNVNVRTPLGVAPIKTADKDISAAPLGLSDCGNPNPTLG